MSPSAAREDGNSTQNDATDEIMDRLVQSVTQNPSDRQSSPKNRRRSRVNRKSCEYRWFPGPTRWVRDGEEGDLPNDLSVIKQQLPCVQNS